MIRNYFKIAWRNITRHKAFAAINIAGLAIGMAGSIFILLWVQHEQSYDRFHKNANEIYRIVGNAGDFKAAITPAVMAHELKAKIPAIKNTTRTTQFSLEMFEVDNRKFEEKRVLYADSTFLQVFSFPLVKGDPATALSRIDGVVITEDMAKKYFGDKDPMGKIMKRGNNENSVVTGVLANIPGNSHLQFDCLLPMAFLARTNSDLKNGRWDNFDFYSYLRLDPNFKPTPEALVSINKQMDDIYKSHIDEAILKVNFQLQPLTDIHLYSSYNMDVPGHGNIQYVNILFVVAVFILAVACINFMNLATARSARRAKEVGLRKVAGADRKQLIGQFLGESMLISFIALLIAVGIVFLLMPWFNELAGKKISVGLPDFKFVLTLLGIALLTGLLSGSYPALFLSGFQPVKVLKGNMKKMGGNVIFRNSLVVTQFVVSIILLAGTAVVYKQLSFIRNMNLGFEKSNLLYTHMTGEMWSKKQALNAELKQNPLTENFCFTNLLPTNLISGTTNVQWEGKDPNSQIVFPTLFVDENFSDVFQIKILNGRHFSKDFTDSNSVILNEKAVQAMGMTTATAVGKQISLWDKKRNVVGVVQDFNFKPIQQPIEPLIMGLNNRGGIAVIRTQAGKTQETIKALENISTKLNPTFPFSFGFVDQDLAQLYKGEQQMGSLFNVFSILAIFISCMGLYGLSAFMAEQRTKEIGVRKVLGASVLNVVYLLSKGFTKLILIAMVIALPVSWFAINSWLKGFAYRVDADWILFVAASLTALAIAWITVSYESIRAALANPVKSLRTE